MDPAPPPKISVILPVFGNMGDLERLVGQLREQTLPPYEILLVDSSPDPVCEQPAGATLLRNPQNVALSGDYNFGARHAQGDFILNMQQDCIPEDRRAVETLHAALVAAPDTVAAVGLVTLPRQIYEGYNFWGKVLMARWVGRVRQGISGKFDLIRKEVFDRIGGYDTTTFRFAGEDMDLHLRLCEQGGVALTPVEIVHHHFQSSSVSWRDPFKKHYQLAESFGALVRRWGPRLRQVPYSGRWTHHLAKYLYPLVLLLPIFPLPIGTALWVGSNFCNLESWRIRSWQTPLLLVVNPALFLTGFAGTVRGLITGKQQFSVNR